MARHDESTGRRNGLFTDADLGRDESWPDAPEPSWLSDGDDDTQSIPAYDLGSGTESVVVDLTGPQPTMTTPPAEALTERYPEPYSEPYSESYAEPYSEPFPETQSRHAAPEAAPPAATAAPEPAPPSAD